MANIYKERLREICAVHTNKNAILVVSNAHKSQDVKLHFLYLCKTVCQPKIPLLQSNDLIPTHAFIRLLGHNGITVTQSSVYRLNSR